MAKAVRVVTSLRALNNGRWLDDGPLIMGTERSLVEAQGYAHELGLASIVFVREDLRPPRNFQQYDWVAGSWVEGRS
jgi:hypothetical protein